MPNATTRPEDPYAEVAELYDLDCGDIEDDVVFYEGLARRCEGPVLELGAGTGRVAIPLARAGFEVCGIDASEAMLAAAGRKAGRELDSKLHLRVGCMEDFDLGRKFELIFAAFGTFQHLITAEEQAACLRCVRRHLRPGGLFAFDVRPLLFEEWEEGESVPLTHEWTRMLPGSGQTVTKLRAVRADRSRQVRQETHIFDTQSDDGTVRRTISTFDLRFSSRYEVEGMLRDSGLELDQMYGDFELSPCDDASEHMIAVASRPREER